jgi:hypothetical protein
MAEVGDPDAVRFYIQFYENNASTGSLPPPVRKQRRASPKVVRVHKFAFMNAANYMFALCGQSNVGGRAAGFRATDTGITCPECLHLLGKTP